MLKPFIFNNFYDIVPTQCFFSSECKHHTYHPQMTWTHTEKKWCARGAEARARKAFVRQVFPHVCLCGWWKWCRWNFEACFVRQVCIFYLTTFAHQTFRARFSSSKTPLSSLFYENDDEWSVSEHFIWSVSEHFISPRTVVALSVVSIGASLKRPYYM